MTPGASIVSVLACLVVVAACSSGHGSLEPEDFGGTGGSGDGGEAGNNGLPDTVAIHPSTDGWLDRSDNLLGLQGGWYDHASTDSTVSYTISETEICAQGSGAQVLGDPPQWGEYYGAAVGFNVCATAASDDPPDTIYTLGTCPWAEEVDSQIFGIGFEISGTLPGELRVIFKEQARDYSNYVVVPDAGEFVALFQDASIAYRPDAPPLDVRNLEAIEFLVATNRSGPSPFDFCIGNLEAITGGEWDTSGVPDWALQPGPGLQVELVGVNMAGAEFGQDSLPGVYGTDYIYPGTDEVDWTVATGMNVIRLPFRWERLQQSLGGELDAEELARLDEFVSYATGAGVSVIIDPHNFARYEDQVVGEDIPESSLADFWGRVAAHYQGNDRVIFGLMNEPHDMQTEAWLSSANASIQAIRDTGATNLILVPGNAWTGAHNWTADYYGTPNSVAMLDVVDPGDNFVFEVHQYLDANNSGGGMTCVSETIGSERLAEFTDWARTHGYRAFLGEFGAPANETCLRALDDMLSYVGNNNDVWMGWAYWAAGPWWGGYRLSIQPDANGEDKTQTYILARHL